MHVFEADTANRAWRLAANALNDLPAVELQASRSGPTKEILHAIVKVENPIERWVLCREPAFNPAFALVEVVWILSGRRDSAFPNFWNPILPRFAGKGDSYHGAYGYRLRAQFDFDQIERAYQALHNNPTSRQVVLQIFDPRVDAPDEDGSPAAEDIPCNVCSLLKVRNGRLEWLQVMRSNDLVKGLPYNLIQFTTLQEFMASWLELEVGPYTHVSDSLHVYEHDIANLGRVSDLEPEPNTDRWRLDYPASIRVLAELGGRLDRMRAEDLTAAEMAEVAEGDDLPEAAGNLLRLVGADAARRRRYHDLSANLIEGCTNPVLRQGWARWRDRTVPSHRP